eukprot:SAG11_NODE_11792_length_738_cov_0.809077_1_plen_84_part_00
MLLLLAVTDAAAALMIGWQDPYELRNLIEAPTHALVREVMRDRLLRRMIQAGEQKPSIVLLGDAYKAGVAGAGQGMRDEEAWM